MSITMSVSVTSCRTVWSPSKIARAWRKPTANAARIPNFYLRPAPELEALFRAYPEAVANTLKIAECCTLDITKDLSYSFPDYGHPGRTDSGCLAGETVS